MSSDERPTDKQLHVPVVLVVGGTPDLVRAVEEAALGTQVLMTRCALADLTTVAAEIRPLVMVMSEEIYGFDPESFEALAQDVASKVLTVGAGEPRVDELMARLKALMLDAEEHGPGWVGER